MAPKWQAKDDYFETCNCRTLCPCISLSPPTEGNCTVLEWHIESGKFGYASLDGLNVAALFHSTGPIHKSNWSAALYLDSRASAEQSDLSSKSSRTNEKFETESRSQQRAQDQDQNCPERP